MDKEAFFVSCSCLLNWVALARIWEEKYTSRVLQIWAEVSQFTIQGRIPSDIEESNHGSMTQSIDPVIPNPRNLD